MATVLEVSNLSVSFRSGAGGGLRRPKRIRVVEGVSFSIERGEVLALVGESGSGKSTVARAILRLVPIEEGQIVLNGVDVSRLSERALRPLRRNAQMVFQDPYSSLDPAMTAAEIIEESLRATGTARADRLPVVRDTLDSVGMSFDVSDRYPHEFSGGQRQRIAIARALAPDPSLIVCDEPVSALDLSTQNQVISLLDRLRSERDVSYLFISHDLSVVRQIADRIAVMYAGQIVEEGPTERVFERPTHPYTLALLSAIPRVTADRDKRGKRIILSGDLPTPGDPPPGCRFHTRCPYAFEPCSTSPPPMSAAQGGGHVACHLHDLGTKLSGASVTSLLEVGSRPSESQSDDAEDSTGSGQ